MALSRGSSRGRPDTNVTSGCVITFAANRTSPQFEASQITLKPQITAAAVILFCSCETSTHERLFNCILTLTVEVLDAIQRPTVAGMKLSEHVHEFLVLLSLSLSFFLCEMVPERCLRSQPGWMLSACRPRPNCNNGCAFMAIQTWKYFLSARFL